MNPKTGAIIRAFTNNKGGTGKSTSCVNIAALVAQARPDTAVLIIDLDPQSHVARFLGLTEKTQGMCVGNVLKDPSKLRANIVNAGRPDYPRRNLFVIPSSRDLEMTVEEIVALSTVRARRGENVLNTLLADALSGLAETFGYIFIDCPPNLGSLTNAVYNFAHEAVVPTATKAVDFDGAQEHTLQLDRLRRQMPDVIQAKLRYVIPTMYDARTRQAIRVVEAMREVYGLETVTIPIPERVEVKEAPENGLTLYEYARAVGKESQSLVAYAGIARRMI